MSDQSGYAERQSEWLKNTGVTVGDKVLICDSIGIDKEWGTNTVWIQDMEKNGWTELAGVRD
jgi:hypothetical protein